MSDRTRAPAEVAEEEELLERVEDHLAQAGGRGPEGADYDAELIALRDAIAEARPEDVPPLVEHMTRLQALAAQRGLGEDIPVDPASPYFGHLRLEERGGERDVLLGKRTYLSPEKGIRIVDWRNAPVSRMYYSYDQGDDYEETFGGKMRQGRIAARRSVTITEGRLERIASVDGVYARRGDRWVELDPSSSRLAGGQGTSIRAEGLSPVRGVLGVDGDGVDRRDKHLPEIAALLDRRQFELIAGDPSGLVVVQGGAGSGKTTVGLHRIAYLAYQEPQRFRSRRMMVVVFNAGLAAYISRVLPALGVNGVRVSTFGDWARSMRRMNIRGLPTGYSHDTPPVVSRLKKHPAMLRILDDMIDQQDEELSDALLDAVSGTPHEERAVAVWRALGRVPLDSRRGRMMRWLGGDAGVAGDRGTDLHPRTMRAAESALGRMHRVTREVVTDWADLLTDREGLGEKIGVHAPAEFSDGELDEVHEWCSAIYKGLDGRDDDPPVLDREDEAILLRLHQLKRGWIRIRGGRLVYDHLMVDEAQDFSSIEMAVMMQTVGRNRPVTFAGDTAQKIVRDSGFVSWDELLADLGIQGRRIEPLNVAYRSTAEIMRLAVDVLGHLSGDSQPEPRRQGAPVELHRFSDPGQAVGYLGEALRDLASREPLANVAVVARHIGQARTYFDGLEKAEVPRLSLVVDEDFSFTAGVEVTAVRQVKGLEFDYVILVEVNADSYPANDEARHLLHVGATRAAHQLWVLTTGKPSPLLPKWLVDGDAS